MSEGKKHIPAHRVTLPPELTWSPETKRYVITLGLIVLVGLIYLARGVLPLLVWSVIIAFLLNPFVNLLTRLRLPRFIATVIVYIFFLLGLLLVPAVAIPLIIQQIMAIPIDPQAWALSIYLWLTHLLEHYMQGSILGYTYDLTPYLGLWLEWLQSGAWIQAIPNMNQIITALQGILMTTTSFIVGATGFAGALILQMISGLFAFFLTLLYTFYLLLVAPRLRIGLYELFPETHHQEIACLIDRIVQTWRRYLRGQVFLCIVIFFMTWIGLSLVGMPGAFTLALVAGALEVIPNLGPILATIPAVVVALLQGSTRLHVNHFEFMLITMGLYALIQQLENNLLVPRIVGSAVHLHPFIVLVGIVVGAQVGGVLGAFLAAPTLATLRHIAQYVHAHLLDRPPYPHLIKPQHPLPQETLPPAARGPAQDKEPSTS